MRKRALIPKAKATFAALFIGTLGGALFHFASLPLPWMLGSMFATTLVSMAWAGLSIPRYARPPMLAVLGVLLGSGFDDTVINNIGAWLPTIASLPIYVLLIGGTSIVYLRLVAKYDWRTAFYSGTPGGLGEMVLIGEQSGGDARKIALVHSVRVMLIVFCVPFLIEWFASADLSQASGSSMGVASLPGQLILLLCAVLGALGGSAIRLPAASLIGPMILSALVHIFGIVEGSPPPIVVSVAQLVIGCSIGVRFAGFRFHEVIQTIMVGLGLTTFMFATATLLGFAIHLIFGVPAMLVFLAYVPGGLAEMALISFALNLDPAFVTTHHIIRVALVVAFSPIIFKWFEKRAANASQTNLNDKSD